MQAYLQVCVCMYTTHVNVCMHVCFYVCTQVCFMRIILYVCLFLCMHTHACMFVCVKLVHFFHYSPNRFHRGLPIVRRRVREHALVCACMCVCMSLCVYQAGCAICTAKVSSPFPMATRYKPLPAIAIKSLETSVTFEDVLRISRSRLYADKDNRRFLRLSRDLFRLFRLERSNGRKGKA